MTSRRGRKNMFDTVNNLKMDIKFVRIMESLTGKQFDSAGAALEVTKKAHVNNAFNILAVSEGLRNMALMSGSGVPKSWVPHPGLGLILDRSLPYAVIIAREAAINKATFSRLTSKYVATRQNADPRVEREIGKQLGYIQPHPLSVDGIVTVHLNLPTKDNSLNRIVSEFGPQTIHMTKTLTTTLTTTLHQMQHSWNALAQAVHPEFEVHVSLLLFPRIVTRSSEK